MQIGKVEASIETMFDKTITETNTNFTNWKCTQIFNLFLLEKNMPKASYMEIIQTRFK